MRLKKLILSVAIAALAIGIFAAPKAYADGDESYFFNRRKSEAEPYSLVGPHQSMDATNDAIQWSLQNGYQVEWEADGSAPRILLEQTQQVVVKQATKVVIVPKIIYVKPAYTWHKWSHYRYYWKSWKVKYSYNPYYHWKHYKKFKFVKKHKHFKHHKKFKVKKFKHKRFKHKAKKTFKKKVRKIRRRR